jgi:hypothetical protein
VPQAGSSRRMIGQNLLCPSCLSDNVVTAFRPPRFAQRGTSLRLCRGRPSARRLFGIFCVSVADTVQQCCCSAAQNTHPVVMLSPSDRMHEGSELPISQASKPKNESLENGGLSGSQQMPVWYLTPMKKAKSRSRTSAPNKSSAAQTTASNEVDKYLASVPEPARTTLKSIRAAIRSVVPPETTEGISYMVRQASPQLSPEKSSQSPHRPKRIQSEALSRPKPLNLSVPRNGARPDPHSSVF